jgi:hypothetical protein
LRAFVRAGAKPPLKEDAAIAVHRGAPRDPPISIKEWNMDTRTKEWKKAAEEAASVILLHSWERMKRVKEEQPHQ